MQNNGAYHSQYTPPQIDDSTNVELYDMFWGGVEAGKKTFEDVITKTQSTISSAG